MCHGSRRDDDGFINIIGVPTRNKQEIHFLYRFFNAGEESSRLIECLGDHIVLVLIQIKTFEKASKQVLIQMIELSTMI